MARERLLPRPDGLVRITLKKAYTDGTVAVDMDPLSLLCRLATSVPPPRLHTVRYAGVLAAASAPCPPRGPAPSTHGSDTTSAGAGPSAGVTRVTAPARAAGLPSRQPLHLSRAARGTAKRGART